MATMPHAGGDTDGAGGAVRIRWLTETRVRRLAIGAGIVLMLAITGRVLGFPLQHDEQFYVPAGVLFDWTGLYDDTGYSHLPNLPLLLRTLYDLTGTTAYLAIGRLAIVGAWIAAVAAIVAIGRDRAGGVLATATMVALLACNALFLDVTGMAVTNNFLAVPFALLGLHCFLRATDNDSPRPGRAFAAGLLLGISAGVKANYAVLVLPFAVASVLVPARWPIARRLRTVTLPLFVGGVVGAAPTLWFLLDNPASFIAHTIHFHAGPQLDYLAANPDPLDPKVIDLRDKLLLASRLWMAGATLVLVVALTFVAILRVDQVGGPARVRAAFAWPVRLAATLALLGTALAFVPSPAFAQYYTLPIPFAVVLLGMIHGTLDAPRRAAAAPLLASALAITVLIALPLLVHGLASLVRPSDWTGARVHADARRIAAMTPPGGPIATLAPLYPLEGGRAIYPGLAMGPFVYRALAWVPADELRHYRWFVTPETLDGLLTRHPPAAILTGLEGPLEAPMIAYARAAGYRAHPVALGRIDNDGSPVVFVRPLPRDPARSPAPGAGAAAAGGPAPRQAALRDDRSARPPR